MFSIAKLKSIFRGGFCGRWCQNGGLRRERTEISLEVDCVEKDLD